MWYYALLGLRAPKRLKKSAILHKKSVIFGKFVKNLFYQYYSINKSRLLNFGG